MTAAIPGVDEVHAVLLERIGAGLIPVGAKLPSCRALADELGSNPSTVNRAIRRLARHGLVRTEARRGTFLVNAGAAPELGRDEVERAVREAVLAARRSGLGTARIRELFESALAIGSRGAGIVAFVECNQRDLDQMAQLVENTTGVALKPILLDDLRRGWESEFDAIATPMFHLADLVAVSEDLDKVVELNFLPSSSALRELAMLSPDTDVGVAAPTPRGVERIRALVGQYYGGPIVVADLDKKAESQRLDVLVHPRALTISQEMVGRARQFLAIDWELDPSSASSFAARVASAVARNDL